MNLFDTIKKFYNSTSFENINENDESSNCDKIKQLEEEINSLQSVEIQNFIDKIHSFIVEIKLNQLSKYLNEFKLYFRNYIKEYKVDVSKSTFLEFEDSEKRKQLEKTLEDTETVKIFKIIMNDYKTLLNPDLTIERIKYFAQFLNIEIDEYAAQMYLKFINYGNKNGGWQEYNYSLINLNDLV